MTQQTLKFINDRLEAAGLNYHFARYNYGDGSPVYPYCVGSYSENNAETEDGLQETDFTVNVWTRGEWLELEQVKARIKAIFPVIGTTAILPDGFGVAVSYVRSDPIPTGDDELKRIEITLSIKEWSV